MSSTPKVRPCPRPSAHEPESKLKKQAKQLPAYEAYRGHITRILGLHHWLAGNYRDALIALVGVLLAAAGIIVANVGILDAHHAAFCCCKKVARRFRIQKMKKNSPNRPIARRPCGCAARYPRILRRRRRHRPRPPRQASMHRARTAVLDHNRRSPGRTGGALLLCQCVQDTIL